MISHRIGYVNAIGPQPLYEYDPVYVDVSWDSEDQLRDGIFLSDLSAMKATVGKELVNTGGNHYYFHFGMWCLLDSILNGSALPNRSKEDLQRILDLWRQNENANVQD